MIYYFCPDMEVKSAGIRLLYRHVQLLQRNGIPAFILHHQEGFRRADLGDVPVRWLSVPRTLVAGDLVVVPEGYPGVMKALQTLPLRRFVIALGWAYIYKAIDGFYDWRAFNIERVLVSSPFVDDFVRWSMGLPTSRFVTGIDEQLYHYRPDEKVAQVSYIARKGNCEELRRALFSRDRTLIEGITWKAHSALTEAEYAAEIRKSRVFLNLSEAEGLPLSMLEAMRAGTIVLGYHSVGGQRELIGSGPLQNCVLAENLDYVTLARHAEGLLRDVRDGRMDRWAACIANGLATASAFTMEAEEKSVVALWRDLLDRGADR